MLSKYRTVLLTSLCILLCLLGYTNHLLLRIAPTKHLTTAVIEASQECTSAAKRIPLENSEFSFSTGHQTWGGSTTRCQSKWFKPVSKFALIEFAGHPNFNSSTGVFLEQKTRNQTQMIKIPLPAVSPAASWKQAQVTFPNIESEYRFVLLRELNSKAWIALRKTIEFHQRWEFLNAARIYISKPPIPILMQYALAILLATILLGFQKGSKSTFFILALFSTLIHFRFDLFFRDDEWRMLSSFRELGFLTVLSPHNEHFIPLFLTSYLSQLAIFGPWYSGYVLVSLVIHSLNAFLLYKILLALSRDKKAANLPAQICTLAYAVLAVHTQTIHWVAVQGQLLAILAELACIYLLLKSSLSRKLTLALSALCCLSASMFFATGILAGLHALAFCLLFPKAASTKFSSLALFSMAFGVSAMIYLMMGVNSSPGMTKLFSEPSYIEPLVNYLLVALCIGSVFRGLGISTSASLDGFHRAFEVVTPFLSVVSFSMAFTTALFVGIFIYYLKTSGRDARLSYFLFGLFWLFTTLLLPAAGRAMLGAHHAMTLRYHSYSIIGLAIMLYPLVLEMRNYVYNMKVGKYKIALQTILLFVFVIFFKGQINFSAGIKNYWRDGASLNQWYQRGLHFEDVLKDNSEAKLLSYSDRGLRAEPRIGYLAMDELIRGQKKTN